MPDPAAPDPNRFRTARSTLLVDRAMTWIIKVGGVGIILAVSAIFVFILVVILPLFRHARVTSEGERAGSVARPLVLGVDEWGELPFTLDEAGEVRFLPRSGGAQVERVPLQKDERLLCAVYDQHHQHLAAGTSVGRVLQATVRFTSTPTDSSPRVSAVLEAGAATSIGVPGQPVVALGFGAGEKTVIAAVQEVAGRRALHVVAFSGSEESWRTDATPLLPGPPQRVLIDERGEQIAVVDGEGRVSVLLAGDSGASLFQEPFRPFADLPDTHVASVGYLLGDVSLVFTARGGQNRIWSLFIDAAKQKRQYGLTKTLPDLHAGATAFAASQRNKAFLLADGRELSLRFATLATVRWQGEVPFPVAAVVISGKYQRLFALDDHGSVHGFGLDDPHPEAGVAAYFGKVWYEGSDHPEWEWQSTAASDDAEPKLSLVPLIFGTLKGTLFAMLFSLPVAILGAVYTAEFMHPRFKSLVKPTIEVMASLPSVVLGFLAALWLAPLIKDRVPSVLCCVLALPASAMIFGFFWSRLGDSVRSRIRPGYEFLAYLPVMLLALWLAWSAGAPLERWLFDGNFRDWWPRATHASFELRNSLVVGFMMGFAVIPIIFTIVEDALTNVPKALRSGSLALGASRWQTAMRVVLPTASAGILSAVMIGLGRAIGETMIMVMATGNTAIMDFNIFDGMRTLSANIAVELPEATAGSTHFRTLFLGAFLLFLMTFLVNTLAEVLRQHLRQKYKTV